MFGLGFGEIFILALIGLIVIGPKQLPDMMKGVARFVKEVSKARQDWMNTVRTDEDIRGIHESMNEVKDSVNKPLQHIKRSIQSELDKLDVRPEINDAVDEMTEIYNQEDRKKITKKDRDSDEH